MHVFAHFLASKILRSRDGSYSTLCPPQSPTQSKETLDMEYLNIWASVFWGHFIHPLSPIIRFFKDHLVFSPIEKSNNALPLVNA